MAKSKKQIHIALDDDMMSKLHAYSKAKNLSMTACVEKGLLTIFNDENVNTDIIQKLLETFFIVSTSGLNTMSFFSCLYRLAKVYPHKSSKDFWGDSVYILQKELTHSEVFNEIKSRFNILKSLPVKNSS